MIVKKYETDETSGTSSRYQSSPLIAIFHDGTIVIYLFNYLCILAELRTCCQQQGKLIQALLCLFQCSYGENRQWEGSRVGEGGTTHTPVNALIDSRHMSIPARRWHDGRGALTNRGQQRASELTWPVRGEKQDHQAHNAQQSTLSTYHLTNIDSILGLYLSFNY